MEYDPPFTSSVYILCLHPLFAYRVDSFLTKKVGQFFLPDPDSPEAIHLTSNPLTVTDHVAKSGV